MTNICGIEVLICPSRANTILRSLNCSSDGKDFACCKLPAIPIDTKIPSFHAFTIKVLLNSAQMILIVKCEIR